MKALTGHVVAESTPVNVLRNGAQFALVIPFHPQQVVDHLGVTLRLGGYNRRLIQIVWTKSITTTTTATDHHIRLQT